MIPQDTPHVWSAEALLNKAQTYGEEMLTFTKDDWRFTFWSTLTLELLGRAALANISPALVADSKNNWNNLLFSLGIQPKVTNFMPRAVDVSEVFNRLQDLIQDFTPELSTFCKGHMSKRNEELHSGATPFVGTGVSSWLPTYYRAFGVLLGSMDDSLDRFLGASEAALAKDMIVAAMDESAKSIKQLVNARTVVWDNFSDEEKQRLHLQSATWATRQSGHRVSCPACGCVAMLDGSPIAPPVKGIEEDEITETQEYLPSMFECVGCGLKITGLPQLTAVGLGDTYTARFTYDAAEYYVYDAGYDGYEPDFNEP